MRIFTLPPRRFDIIELLTLLALFLTQGEAGAAPSTSSPRTATAADQLAVLPGFQVELIRSAHPAEGSWVCLTVDDQGRLIVSPQEGIGNLLRVGLSAEGQVAKIDTIPQPVGSAMGLLYTSDTLYVNGRGPEGLGLYRLQHRPGDDQFEPPKLLRKFEGAGGEHGSHAVLLGPDHKLYVVNGNFVKLPKDLSENSPHRHYAEDQLLPRGEDGNGFGVGIKPPGGSVVRMNLDGSNPELFAAGLRNTYDIAFNRAGELFGFDSDMEWDWGMPWYRPIRINHLVSGGEYGFREGTGKFPSYYPDTLPSSLEIGIGSPTGVKFGDKSQFPERYRDALFAMDWSYGRILAVHLQPQGATYIGHFENFVAPRALHGHGPKAPLNVTDLEFGKDGAMFFITGGRGTQSGLYRVSWTKGLEQATSSVTTNATEQAATNARELRHKLEAFHGKQDSRAVAFAWPLLDSGDRWLRYAARVAIESQPVEQWQTRALNETRLNASLTVLLALARVGPASVQQDLFDALDRWPAEQLTEEQSLDALRVIGLSLIRMGRPEAPLANDIVERLSPLYPAKSWPLNRELSQVLIYLEAPGVVNKTLALLDAAKTQEEQIHYIFHLRTLQHGWTIAERRRYFDWFDRDWKRGQHAPEVLGWFADAGRDYDNGASFPRFLDHFRKDAVASLSPQERTELATVVDRAPLRLPAPAAERTFVRDWRMDQVAPLLDRVAPGRDLERGRATFAAAQCVACHRFAGEGGSVGPDLTAIASRFTRRDILESILDPSKVVSEQYQNVTVFEKNGDDITGRLVEETKSKLVLITNPLTQEKTEVARSDVDRLVPSKVSPMPEGLLNTFKQEDILDLLGYLESGGKSPADTGSAGRQASAP